jgi:hypothetical protein
VQWGEMRARVTQRRMAAALKAKASEGLSKDRGPGIYIQVCYFGGCVIATNKRKPDQTLLIPPKVNFKHAF